MKGIILSGGANTRLYPITRAVSKQLMPVFNKPMIYYPLSTLMLAGINDILIISTGRDLPGFRKLLGNGEHLGCKFTYKIQEEPNGIAEAFIIGEEFIDNQDVALILGDNIFHGQNLSDIFKECANPSGGIVFAYRVADPKRYGVVEFGKNFEVIGIEEKPLKSKSDFAVTGLYFYDNNVVNIAKKLTPSARGELEITDINKEYLKKGQLKVKLFESGTAWLDAGTFQSLLDASQYVKTIEERQAVRIACIEEIAYKKGFITKEQLKNLAKPLLKSGYGEYIMKIVLQS